MKPREGTRAEVRSRMPSVSTFEYAPLAFVARSVFPHLCLHLDALPQGRDPFILDQRPKRGAQRPAVHLQARLHDLRVR